MAFDSRSGFCVTSGPPGPAAPFAPQMCFQTAYVPSGSVANNAFAWDALSCRTNGQSIGSCSFDAECGPGAVCDTGRCWPANQVHSPWTYSAGNPRVVAQMSWQDVSDAARRMNISKEFNEFAQHYAFGQSMFVVEHHGQRCIATPLNVQYFRQDPQCSTCLKTVWQCDRFRDPAKYDPQSAQLHAACLEMEQSFLYDTLLPNGVLVPLMVKMDPVSLPAAMAALQKCAVQCGECGVARP